MYYIYNWGSEWPFEHATIDYVYIRGIDFSDNGSIGTNDLDYIDVCGLDETTTNVNGTNSIDVDGNYISDVVDYDGDGFYLCTEIQDCNDFDSSVNPSQLERCNDEIDNDCDGMYDEEDCEVHYYGDLRIDTASDAESFCSEGYTSADSIYLTSSVNEEDVDLSCLESVHTLYLSGWECNVSPILSMFPISKQHKIYT